MNGSRQRAKAALPPIVEQQLRTISNNGKRRRMRRQIEQMMHPTALKGRARPALRLSERYEAARADGYVPNRHTRRGQRSQAWSRTR